MVTQFLWNKSVWHRSYSEDINLGSSFQFTSYSLYVMLLGMYRISGSYPVIWPIFHYPVSSLLLNYPVSGRISYWYPAGYRIIALLAVTSISRNTPWLLLFLGRIMMMLPLIINSYNLVNFHRNFMKLVLN